MFADRGWLRNLAEEIVLADQVGLDVFGLREHDRQDYASSAPAVALAAAATQPSGVAPKVRKAVADRTQRRVAAAG